MYAKYVDGWKQASVPTVAEEERTWTQFNVSEFWCGEAHFVFVFKHLCRSIEHFVWYGGKEKEKTKKTKKKKSLNVVGALKGLEFGWYVVCIYCQQLLTILGSSLHLWIYVTFADGLGKNPVDDDDDDDDPFL